jgi:hypothetical protein
LFVQIACFRPPVEDIDLATAKKKRKKEKRKKEKKKKI